MSNSRLQSEEVARTTLDQIPGLSWRPVEHADLPAVAEFYEAAETHDGITERTALADLEDYWASQRSRPQEDVLLAWDEAGQIAAVAWASCGRSTTSVRRVFLGGMVRPDRRGEGIGRLVMTWEVAHAHAWDAATREPDFGPLTIEGYSPVALQEMRNLFARFGLAAARYFFEMERPLASIPERRELPGVQIVPWVPQRREEVRQVVNQAFSNHWGHVEVSEQDWEERLTEASFRPQWSLLAVDSETGKVLGYALNCAFEQDWDEEHRTGDTDQLGVLEEFRGRGIASALLVESMHRFVAAGMNGATLAVDSQNASGALGLYESLGYRTISENCVHQLQV